MFDDAAVRHNELIVDQFTRQAIPFAQMHSDEESVRLLMRAAEVSAEDRVLDVACGPGLVACAVAPAVREVVGLDLTPAMIEEARRQQQARGVRNVAWQVGDVTELPYPDCAFSVVLSRYAFHHLIDPAEALREMARVCRPGGRVVVADVFVTNDAQGAAYDRMEKLRDPSHVRALKLEELERMFAAAGVPVGSRAFYRFDVEVERLLAATRTPAAEAEQVRAILAADVGRDELGVAVRRVGDGLRFSFPIVVLAGRKA
jgi:ubiquinone/menaquinone biosynthesis C-methylase UbiE